MAPNSLSNASNPPADEPMPTMGKSAILSPPVALEYLG
jgi:hypothetical protein